MTARVMVFATVAEDQADGFEAAYRTVTAAVKGTPGHIRDELLRQRGRPGGYVLLSEWESADAFLTWEDAPVHRELTTPMRPYWTGRVERVLFDVASPGADHPPAAASVPSIPRPSTTRTTPLESGGAR